MNQEQIQKVRECWDRNNVQMSWNFWCGDTLKEQFEKLISAVIFMANNSSIDDDENPYINIYADPQITSVFETAVKGFDPVPYNEEYIKSEIYKTGIVSFNESKFNLYKDIKARRGEILVTNESDRWGYILKVDNFIYVDRLY